MGIGHDIHALKNCGSHDPGMPLQDLYMLTEVKGTAKSTLSHNDLKP